MTQASPQADSAGWTRAERDALQNEGLVKFRDNVTRNKGLVKFRENVTRKLLKVPLSKNLAVTSFKPSEMDSKTNFFNAIGQWSQASLQFNTWLRTHHVDTIFYIKHEVIIPAIPAVQAVVGQPAIPAANGQPAVPAVQAVQARAAVPERRTAPTVGNLFDIWNTVTLREVFDSCQLYKQYSTSAIELQNMNLSWEFFMSNCDPDLKATIIAEVSNFVAEDADCAQSGPMAYWVMANKLIQATDALSHNVVTGTMDMGLVHYKGENVVDTVAVLRNVLRFLAYGTPTSKAPPTILETLVNVFLRCSVPIFVNYIRNLQDFHETEIDTPEKLFDKAQVYYNKLIGEGKWVRTVKSRAAFMSETPELAATLEAEKRSPPPPSDKGGKGRGGGTQEVDFKGNPIDRNPPTDGKTMRKKANGYNEYWCGKCRGGGRWGSHDDAHHDEWVQKMKDRKKDRQNKKKSDDNQSTTSAPAEVPPPSMHRATVCAPLLSIFRGPDGYDSDQSF